MPETKPGKLPDKASIKNPEHELEKPAPMPHDERPSKGTPKQDKDPAGQQGGYHTGRP